MSDFASINRRFLSAVSLGSLGFAIVVGFLAFAIEYRAQYRQAAELEEQLVATVRASAAVAAFAGNREIAGEVVEGLLANPIVAAVEVVSTHGFYHGRVRLEVLGGGRNVYPLLSPVDQVEQIGELRVFRDEREINRRAVDEAYAHAGFLVLQIAISMMLSMLLFRRVIGRPLLRVAQMLEGASPGCSSRLPIPVGHERDEIGMLVESSNKLLGAAERALDEERRLQAEVSELNAHYRRIFETTNVGIMILRPGGGLLNCNSTLLSRIVGITFDACSLDSCRDFIETIFLDPEAVWNMVWQARDAGQTVAGDVALRTADGSERWAHCMLSVAVDNEGAVDLIEGVLYDVTARRMRESAAQSAAEIDALTGLVNRRGMEKALERMLLHAGKEGHEFGVMLIDLDGFKAINDVHGHAAGDLVLKEVGVRLQAVVRRSQDVIARLGGDEFTVLVSDSNRHPDSLETIAAEIVHRIAQPMMLADGVCVSVQASVGVAACPGDGQNSKDLLARADAAMYGVKRSGKNGYRMARRLLGGELPPAP